MKKITQIFDGDYGCEEREEGSGLWVSVTLADERGEETYVRVPDIWLTERNLDTGSVWPVEGSVFEK